LLIFSGFWFNGLWLAFIGWFLGNAAVGSYRQLTLQQILQGHAVSEAMTRDCLTVPPDLTLVRLVNEHVLPSGNQCFVVTTDSHIQGLITLKIIKAVPREMWATKKVAEVMIPFEELKQIRPDEDLASVFKILTEEVNQLPVVEGGRVIGMISRENLLAFINIRDKLGM